MSSPTMQRVIAEKLMARDSQACSRLQNEIHSRLEQGKPCDRLQARLSRLLDTSQAMVEERRASVPPLHYPPELPVTAQREAILQALARHQVIIVAGETGSGKTTQLPKILLEQGCGTRGRIGHTQPRRIAARTVAVRIAEELGTEVGDLLGYQVRFTDRCGEQSLVKLMTDGILLSEIQKDRYLTQYDALIIDEAHERSLNIDFLLGYLKQILPRRPELKLVITSATIDLDRFSEHFHDAPVIDVSGRTWPVDVQYLEPLDDSRDAGLAEHVLQACEYIQMLEGQGQGHPGGDILVFLPGERDIREVALRLRRSEFSDWDILPLYARLGREEQNRVFKPGQARGRRVVLATNVAETSLTVPGIRYVVDTGLARISRYSHRSRVQRLPIEPISQASAEQRSGRCGRVGEGTCIRLYAEDDFTARPAYTDSEIHRTNLASVILQLTRMRFGDIEQFPFLEAPDRRLVRDGYSLLHELGAIEKSSGLSSIGESISRIPADPRIARMLVEAGDLDCLSEVLVIAACLSIQDPRERPLEKQQAADQAHSRFHSETSDFDALLKLWSYFEEQRQSLSKSQLRKLCRKEFLSWSRMFEWRDLHHQLGTVMRELGYKINRREAALDTVHRALLAGLLSHVGQREERREYRGTRNRQFQLFPGSRLTRKPPSWVMAAELVDTGTVFARTNAAIDPKWVIDAASHLVQYSYSEPHFSERKQAVMARRKTSLFGLVLDDKTLVAYSSIDPDVARDIFIRTALVEGGLRSKAAFWRHNSRLLREARDQEVRLRREGALLNEDRLYEFYAALLPAEVNNRASLDKWRKSVEPTSPKLLYLDQSRFMDGLHGARIAEQFPDVLCLGELSVPLQYTFAPGGETDGVTALIPLAAMNRLDAKRFEWLVPGLLRDKCIELLKSLPRPLRKHLVPVPDAVDRLMPGLASGSGSLYESLAQEISKVFGLSIKRSDFRPDKLDAFYHIYFAVIDTEGKRIACGRDLAQLSRDLKPQLKSTISKLEEGGANQVYQRWDFGILPETRLVSHGSMEVLVYPAVVDSGNAVALEYRDSAGDAIAQSRTGMARLYMLALPQQVKYLKKDFLRSNTLKLQLGLLQAKDELTDDYLLSVFASQFIDTGKLPRNADEFEARLAEQKGALVSRANQYREVVEEIVAQNHTVRNALNGLSPKTWQYAIDDIEQQLDSMLFPRFLTAANYDRICQYPRYLRGIVSRIDKLAGHEQKDRQSVALLQHHISRLQTRVGNLFESLPSSGPISDYRWLIEEFRLSLFAQHIGTRKPVSGKRLDKLWQACEDGIQPDL